MIRGADFLDTDSLTGWGDLDAPPVDMPVVRADVPLKQPRVQIERRASWPTEPVHRQLPASCSDTSITGERVLIVLCLVVLVGWGLLAMLSTHTGMDLLAQLLGAPR